MIDLLAKHSPWGKKPPKGHAYGLAVHESSNSVVGHVAEVSLGGDKPVTGIGPAVIAVYKKAFASSAQ